MLSNSKNIIGVEEAAEILGYRSSYVRKLCQRRKLPHSKPLDGKIFFSKEELENWAMRNKIATDDELDAKAATHVKSTAA